LDGNFDGLKVVNKDIHSFASIHVAASIDIYRTAPCFWKGMYGEMRFRQCVYNGNTLRVELMGETIKNRGSARLNRFFKGGSNPIEIIQQME
jgi:hypothetical protein